jgi:uncharacterized cupin superfamily protein
VVDEARLERSDYGLEAVTPGWFVLNVADGPWVTNEKFADGCIFEGDKACLAELGFSLAVLQPGRPSALYHRESSQEDFLVLSGECLLLVEGEERRLGPWDFFHCPPGTEHILVGAGDGPCVVFMTGSRPNDLEIVYPRSELALRHGAGVEQETSSPRDAYAPFPKWQPGRPANLGPFEPPA